MGLLDRYREFEDVDPEEDRRVRRERRHRERALELEKVPDLDLSGTEWPELPNSEIVNASIFTARGRVNGYPDRHAEGVRAALARLHDVDPERIVMGNGAAELLQAAAMALIEPGDELLTPWPSYPLYPLMATRAGGRPVAVDWHEPLENGISRPHPPGRAVQPQRPDRPLHARPSAWPSWPPRCPSAPTSWSTRRWSSSRTPSRSTRCCG